MSSSSSVEKVKQARTSSSSSSSSSSACARSALNDPWFFSNGSPDFSRKVNPVRKKEVDVQVMLKQLVDVVKSKEEKKKATEDEDTQAEAVLPATTKGIEGKRKNCDNKDEVLQTSSAIKKEVSSNSSNEDSSNNNSSKKKQRKSIGLEEAKSLLGLINEEKNKEKNLSASILNLLK